jgi:outer membrane protein assembly factor BamB
MMSSVLSMRCVSVAAVVLWMNVSCWSADWTQFLGSDGSGVSSADNLPVRWSETEHIAWKVPVAGKGWSSPVVRGDRIFLTTAIPVGEGDAARQALHTICLEAATGSTLWDVEVFRHADGEAVEMHQKNSHASPTPILEGDHLYVHFGPHGTACLTLDGTVVWKNQELIYAPQHGNGGSPAVAGNLLIICCDGKDIQYVAGLDRQTGKVVWKTDRDTDPQKGFSFCTPTIIHVNGQPQAVCPGSSAVFAYDPATGAEIWRVDYGDGYSVVPRPVFAHGLVYVCSGFGDERLFAIDPTGKGNVTATHVRWSTRKSTPKSPSAIVVGEFVFMVSDAGVASCLNAVSGEQLWQQRLGGGFSASPLAAGRHVYFLSEDGKTTVARIGPEYEEVATSQVGDGNTRTFASFAVLGSSLLLRSESHLYRIEE